MSEIRNIILENRVEEIFQLVIPDGDLAGTYTIDKPDGWDEIDSVVNINEEFFNVEDFIIGESEKIKFYQYNTPETFDLIKKINKEYLGDGQIIFKWYAKKGTQTIDILGENFEINLNKYSEGFEKTKLKLELEIKKRESQSKFLNREDTTVNLFDNKSVDQAEIDPVETFTVGYKKGDKQLSNFYTLDIASPISQLSFAKYHLSPFIRADDYGFGINKNESCGFIDYGFGNVRNLGAFVVTDTLLKNVKIEVSNFEVVVVCPDSIARPAKLMAFIDVGTNNVRKEIIKASDPIVTGDDAVKIKIDNITVPIGNVSAGQSISLAVVRDDGDVHKMIALNSNTTIEITTNLSSPLVRTEAVRLNKALNQIARSYTSGQLTVQSNILDEGGYYYNTSVSTGIYLRGLPPVYTVGQKIKTSFKSLFYDGVAPLLALGFDINNNKVIIEDIKYFFKNIQSYDLSNKTFREDDYKIENDKDLFKNQVLFGSKKYSTQVKGDIKNFNTKLEASTPIITSKDKFDKQADIIIDEFRIQELIEDNSTSTNDNDDDMVLIDMVNVTDTWDDAVFENCFHQPFEGNLKLSCQTTPFDTTFITEGSLITITEGINVGTWTVLELGNNYIVVNKTSGITTDTRDTPIRYQISALVKNRTGIEGEGFTNVDKVKELYTAANLRHNPKFQMARWFPYFGSGLVKKPDDKEIVITDYKNNDEVTLQCSDSSLANELQGLIRVGDNVPLNEFRDQYETFFNGQKIEITIPEVDFYEFMDIYNNWKFGAGNDRMLSRGYITVPTPEGLMNVYPFAKGALSHNRFDNELTIKGKIKELFLPNPVLLSVNQINANTVKLTWDYDDKFINPTIKIQYSLDGSNWNLITSVTNVKELEFTNSLFDDFMTGETVYFKVIVSSSEYRNRNSNSQNIVWQYNDYVIREIYNTVNSCGDLNSIIEIKGNIDFTIDWNLESIPGGGSILVTNNNTSEIVTSIMTDYGAIDNKSETTSHSVTLGNSLKLAVNMKLTSRNEDERPINCTSGNTTVYVQDSLYIQFKNTDEELIKEINLYSDFEKFYFNRPSPEEPI